MSRRHREHHRSDRIGWLRAAVLGANAALPLVVTALVPGTSLIVWVAVTAIAFLAVLGAVSARAGGASMAVGAWRVTFWGTLAMAVTAGVGKLFGAVA